MQWDLVANVLKKKESKNLYEINLIFNYKDGIVNL